MPIRRRRVVVATPGRAILLPRPLGPWLCQFCLQPWLCAFARGAELPPCARRQAEPSHGYPIRRPPARFPPQATFLSLIYRRHRLFVRINYLTYFIQHHRPGRCWPTGCACVNASISVILVSQSSDEYSFLRRPTAAVFSRLYFLLSEVARPTFSALTLSLLPTYVLVSVLSVPFGLPGINLATTCHVPYWERPDAPSCSLCHLIDPPTADTHLGCTKHHDTGRSVEGLGREPTRVKVASEVALQSAECRVQRADSGWFGRTGAPHHQRSWGSRTSTKVSSSPTIGVSPVGYSARRPGRAVSGP